MQWGELFKVFRKNFGKYLIWLLANIGGLFIPYLAALMIWLLYREMGSFLPGEDVFLIAGTILLTATMASYQKTKGNESKSNLWIGLYISWPFLLIIVFGMFLSIGIKKPSISSLELWAIVLFIFMLTIIWATTVWLHEQGLIDDKTKIPDKPESDPRLGLATSELPKMTDGGGEA